MLSFRFYLILLLSIWALAFPVAAQEVPKEIRFGDITLDLNRRAQRDVQNRVNFILEDQARFQKKVTLADLYLPLVTEILVSNGLPEDFKYLALLDDKSPDSLIFWQTNPQLVQELDLRVSNEVDERLNVISCTKAVAAKLKNNQSQLKNWALTLLTYHQPIEKVRELLREKGIDIPLAQLTRFPVDENTHPDILQLLAVRVAYESAIGRKLTLDRELISYREAQGKTIEELAKLFYISPDTLRQFNQWLKVEQVPSDKTYDLIVPIPADSPSSEVTIYTSPNGELIYQTPNLSQFHVVEAGETLYRISRNYGVSVEEIKQWNQLSSNDLYIGQQLVIQGQASNTDNNNQNPKEIISPVEVSTQTVIHRVARGESLYAISRRYQVEVSELKAWNNLRSNMLYIGQPLKVNIPKNNSGQSSNTQTDNNNSLPDRQESTDSNNNTDNARNTPQGTRILAAKKVPTQLQVAGIMVKINEAARRLIQKDVDLLLKSPTYFFSKLYRVDIYMPLIDDALQAENIPYDFRYLPIQESALIANAVSRSYAVGYWQFKAASAREVGIEVNNRVDERMNIVASSHGAAHYLKRNNLYYQNWLVALLSYNMGFTGAKNYFKTHYPNWNYRQNKVFEVTEKTHWYLRKFLAHKIAFEQEVGIEARDKRLVRYNEGQNKTLKQIAQETRIAEAKIQPFNQWIKRNRIPNDKTYYVILPVNP